MYIVFVLWHLTFVLFSALSRRVGTSQHFHYWVALLSLYFPSPIFSASHLFSFSLVPSCELCIIHHSLFPGIDEASAAWLLSAIGIANTIGRVTFGFMADLRWVNRLMLYNTALTICGVATALSPFVGGNYALLMTYAAIFGIFIGRCGCLCLTGW